MPIPRRYFKVGITYVYVLMSTEQRYAQILQALTASAKSGQPTVRWDEFHGVRPILEVLQA